MVKVKCGNWHQLAYFQVNECILVFIFLSIAAQQFSSFLKVWLKNALVFFKFSFKK